MLTNHKFKFMVILGIALTFSSFNVFTSTTNLYKTFIPQNNCLEDAMQITSPIDYHYLSELAEDGFLYMIIKANKGLEYQNNSDVKLRNTDIEGISFLFSHVTKEITQNQINERNPFISQLCSWPNMGCNISAAIIGDLPGHLDGVHRIEREKDKVQYLNRVSFNLEHEDLSTDEIDINEIYGTEIVKPSELAKYSDSQHLILEFEFDKFNHDSFREMTIHFFIKNFYNQNSEQEDLINQEIDFKRDRDFIPILSPYLMELELLDIYLCKKIR